MSTTPTTPAQSAPGADAGAVRKALAELARAGIGIADFSVGQPSLDEVFLALTGHTAESEEPDEMAIEGERTS